MTDRENRKAGNVQVENKNEKIDYKIEGGFRREY